MAALRKDSKLELLRGVPLFSNFSKKELEAVSRAADEVDYPAGKVLGQQGAPGGEAFIVVSGEITVRRNGRKVAASRAGDVVGEMSILDNETRSADLVVTEDASVLVIPRRQFLHLLDENPNLAGKMLGVLAGRLREANRALYG
jgi:CRP-like cAMP-binding protein